MAAAGYIVTCLHRPMRLDHRGGRQTLLVPGKRSDITLFRSPQSARQAIRATLEYASTKPPSVAHRYGQPHEFAVRRLTTCDVN